MPVAALVGANMVPLWGVVFLDWDAFYIVLLYWCENLVIGFYNIVKMVLARPLSVAEAEKLGDEAGGEPPVWATGIRYHVSKLFLIPFFAFHYGAFTAGHGFFVLMMFRKDDAGFGQIIQKDEVWPCFLVFVQILLVVVERVYSTMPIAMKYAVAALFVSHGVSFVCNYLYGGEHETAGLNGLMGEPYGRVMVMHIAIIAGAFLSGAIGSPAGVLVMLVVLKTVIDVKLHLRQHRKKQAGAVEAV